MTTRVVGPAKGWDWLMRAVNLGSQNARALFGAAAWLMAIALVPTLVQMLLQKAMPESTAMVGVVMGFTLLYSVIVMPPATAGLWRVIHAVETGAPVRAAALFDGYRQNPGKMIGLSIVLLVLAILVLGGALALFGGHFLQGFEEFVVAAQSASATGKPQIPPLPDGFGTLLGLLVIFGLFFNGVYALSFGQAALGGRGIGEAIRDGIAGTFKNLLPLLVLLVVVLVAGLVAMVAVVLVMGLLTVVGGLIHPAVAVLLVVPVYLALLVAIYVVAFGVMYYMWRDICGDAATPLASPADHLQA
jgi:hypothetical protein